jgi:hypothetical protein
VEKLVSRQAHNLEIVGSSPTAPIGKEIWPNVEQERALLKRHGRGRGEVEHAWCRDPSRDERVRTAEDGRTAPLPTLEECIEGQKQLQTARPCGGTDPAPSRGERGAADTCMQAERVTLEITHDGKHGPVSTWPFECGSYGESVRVVEEELSDAWAQRLARLTSERDAAIRERDELRKSWLRSEESGTRLLAECNAALDAADGLRKRVAELEAASGGNHSPDAGKMVEQEPVACKNCEGAETVWCEHSQQHIGCYCARDTVREDEGQSRVIEVWHESSDPAQAHRARAARLLAKRDAAQARAAELEAASGGGEGA